MKTLKDLENDIKKHQTELKTFITNNAPRIVANKALAIFDDSWNKQGFTNANGGFETWQRRKEDKGSSSDSRGTLIGKGSAKLRRSLRIVGTPTPERITIGTAIPYAQIHNEGGTITIPITDAMRRFFWAKFYESRNQTQKLSQKGKRKIGDKRTQKLGTANSSANKWKNLALTKKTQLTINIPKRQFMGESSLIAPMIDQVLKQGFEEIFK